MVQSVVPTPLHDDHRLRILAAAFDLPGVSITILDDAGRIVAVNAAWRTYADERGMQMPDYGVGQNYLAICEAANTPDSLACARGIRTVIRRQAHQFEFEYLLMQDEDREYWYRMRVIGSDQDGQRYAIISHEDISEIRMMQAAHARQQALLAHEQEISTLKTRLMERIAHEFRTPLTVIQNAAYLAEQKYEVQPEAVRQFTLIREQIQRLDRMLANITQMLRNEYALVHFQPQATDLQLLLDDILHSHEPTWQKRIILHNDTHLKTVWLDALLVELILYNLLSNALKYSPAESLVHLRCSRPAPDRIRFEVEDAGMGIAPDDQAHIFQSFYRGQQGSHKAGLGLGLALVWDAVQRHQGTITLASEVGRGTVFMVELPIRE
jgi:signal transduction histidine kinase